MRRNQPFTPFEDNSLTHQRATFEIAARVANAWQPCGTENDPSQRLFDILARFATELGPQNHQKPPRPADRKGKGMRSVIDHRPPLRKSPTGMRSMLNESFGKSHAEARCNNESSVVVVDKSTFAWLVPLLMVALTISSTNVTNKETLAHLRRRSFFATVAQTMATRQVYLEAGRWLLVWTAVRIRTAPECLPIRS